MAKLPKLMFRAGKSKDSPSSFGRYQHLHFSIRLAPEEEYDSDTELFEIEWQTDSDRAESHWYGFHYQIRESNIASLQLVTSILKKIERSLPKTTDGYENTLRFGTTPDEILLAFHKAGIEERVYDDRVRPSWVPIGQVMHPDIKKWADDWRIMGASSITVSAVASNEEQAKERIGRDLEDKYTEVYEKWKELGEPVMVISNGPSRPVVTAKDLLPISW